MFNEYACGVGGTSRVAHDDTRMRIAVRPCQSVGPHQQVPSRYTRSIACRVMAAPPKETFIGCMRGSMGRPGNGSRCRTAYWAEGRQRCSSCVRSGGYPIATVLYATWTRGRSGSSARFSRQRLVAAWPIIGSGITGVPNRVCRIACPLTCSRGRRARTNRCSPPPMSRPSRR